VLRRLLRTGCQPTGPALSWRRGLQGKEHFCQASRRSRAITRFPLASGRVAARARGLGGELRCGVELTEITTRGQNWWTLGFEATAPPDLLRSELQATAALVFAQPLPGGVELGPVESRS
jgi:hypothetical protein